MSAKEIKKLAGGSKISSKGFTGSGDKKLKAKGKKIGAKTRAKAKKLRL